MSKYYKAGPEIAALCEAATEDEKRTVDEGCKLSRKHGGSRNDVVTVRNSMGELVVIGFKFSKPDAADPKLFKTIKNADGAWMVPRRGTKKGKELAAQLNSLKSAAYRKVIDAIGMKMFYGCTVRFPGRSYIKGHWYLIVPEDVDAKGCTRISDVEWEKLNAKGKKGSPPLPQRQGGAR